MSKEEYNGIDIARFFFACLIPFLHIELSGAFVPFVQQYISRLGVPFFFTVSGMFLSKNLASRHKVEVWKKFAGRIGILLAVWIIIYSPLFFKNGYLFRVNKMIFDTPGYLWYLTAVLFASVPFCFIANRRILYAVSACLYFLGTFCSESYKWMCGGGVERL